MCESASGESGDAPLAQRPGPRSWLLAPLLRSCLSNRTASLSGRGCGKEEERNSVSKRFSFLIQVPVVRLSPETNHAARLGMKVHVHGQEMSTA
jgi:hypothetical protein